jgi:hypothetical protein
MANRKAAQVWPGTSGTTTKDFFVTDRGPCVGTDTPTVDGITDDGDLVVTGTATIGTQKIANATGAVLELNRDDTSIADGDLLGELTGTGEDPTTGLVGAKIRMEAAGTWASADNPGEIQFFTNPDTGAVQVAVIDKDGNVGIGTTSPASPLVIAVDGAATPIHIDQTGNPIILVESQTASGNAAVDFENTTQRWRVQLEGVSSGWRVRDVTGATNPLVILPAAVTNALYLTSAGVGAQETSPKSALTVGGDGVLSLDETTAPSSDAGYGKVWTESDNRLYFQDGGGTEHVVTHDYAGISVIDNTTATVISSAGTAVQVTVFDTNDPSQGATPDHTNDHITIAATGDYHIIVAASVNSIAGASSRFEMTVQKNNGASVVGPMHVDRNISGGGGNTGSVGMSGIATLTAADTLEVWIENETNTQNYIVENITLSIIRLDA